MNELRKIIGVQKWVTVTGLLLLIIKFAAYFHTGSVAILTDALESIVNVVAGFISLYSLHLSAKPRDSDHPYGHGKAEFISAGIEGALIIVAGVFIIIEAANKILHPSALHQLDLGILLIGICGAVNFIAGKIALRTGRQYRSLAISATGSHLISDALSTLGLLAGLLLMFYTKLPWLDSAVALVFALIIMTTGIRIIRSSVAGIMDEADTELLQQLVTLLNKERRSEWIDLHNLRVIKYGSGLHVDCHLTLPWYYNLHEAHKELDQLTAIVKNEFGGSLEFFVHTDGCLPFSCRICTLDQCSVRQHPFGKKIEWTVDNIFENKKHEFTTH